MDVFACEGGDEVLTPAAELGVEHAEDALADGAEGGAGGAPIDAALDDVALDLLLDAGDSDLEEFVEVRAGDDEELEAFEKRIRRVEGFVEDALVEVEPAQFAAEEVLRVEGLHRAT